MSTSDRFLAVPIVAGNWKLNKSPADTRAFFDSFLRQAKLDREGSLVFFPPALSLAAALDATSGTGSRLSLGVQNVYWESSGAFTGEISAPMAQEAGATIALVGHSERRHVFGETNEDTHRKVSACLAADLHVVLCIGELLTEREQGRAESVVAEQLDAGLAGVAEEDFGSLLIAYEPVWAIGTGKTATADDASAMHRHIRSRLTERFGTTAERLPILYGGSVKPDNAAELLRAPDVDGLLVGGASLDPDSFAAIWSSAP